MTSQTGSECFMNIEPSHFTDASGAMALVVDGDGFPRPQLIGGQPHLGNIAHALYSNMQSLTKDERALVASWVEQYDPKYEMDDAEVTHIEELSAEAEAEMQARGRHIYRVTHHYSIGNQDVFVKDPTGMMDGKRVGAYLFLKAYDFFDSPGFLVSNLGIAAAMVSLYGFEHCAAHPFATPVDLYHDVEGKSKELMADASLHREGIREALAPHLDGLKPSKPWP